MQGNQFSWITKRHSTLCLPASARHDDDDSALAGYYWETRHHRGAHSGAATAHTRTYMKYFGHLDTCMGAMLLEE